MLRIIRANGDERGQVLVIGLIVSLGIVAAAFTVGNVGMMVAEKMHVQDSVDAAAYSSAVFQARYMNLSAYMTRAMIANYDSMAFNTAVWAVIDADDHGIAPIVALLYQISTVLFLFPITTAFAPDVDQVADLLRDYVHHPLHTLNHYLNDFFAQDDDAQDLNQYIEIMNTHLLTMYEGMLYAATQSARHSVASEVVKKMDKDILTTSVLGLGAETVNYDELAKAADWVIRDVDARGQPFQILNDRFNKMHGENEDEDNVLFLGATTEASLDKFVAGRTRNGDSDLLRNFNVGNIIPGASAIEFALDVYCYGLCIGSLGFSGCDCDAEVDLILGANMREGEENKASESHVPFIARQRMREVNFFGMDFKVDGVPGADAIEKFIGRQGHTSGEKNNDVANVANATPQLGEEFDTGRALECIQTGCFPATRGLNFFNILQAEVMLPASIIVPPLFVDDHWDGTYEDVEPVCSWEIIPPATCFPDTIEYEANVVSDGPEEGVPKYDWNVDLDNVGFANYRYPTDGAQKRPAGTKGGGEEENRVLTGPSVAVVGVKNRSKINTLRALNVGNTYSISAMARAQVYYVRNPNRPKEKPSLLNPHWVARLAPLDSEDTPPLLKEGLPYVSSIGIPLKPTH